MAEPLSVVAPPPTFPPARERAPRRVRRAIRGWSRAVLGLVVRPARLLPALGSVACTVAGAYLLWGLGVALLVAGGFLLWLDLRTPAAG